MRVRWSEPACQRIFRWENLENSMKFPLARREPGKAVRNTLTLPLLQKAILTLP
jgi:hypothetical protein